MNPNNNPSRQHQQGTWPREIMRLPRVRERRRLEVSIGVESDLTVDNIEALLLLIDTPAKRRHVLGLLCTLRESAEALFMYHDSPLRGQTQHPMFSVMAIVNEIVGCLLLYDDRLQVDRSPYGGVSVKVVERGGNSDKTPQ